MIVDVGCLAGYLSEGGVTQDALPVAIPTRVVGPPSFSFKRRPTDEAEEEEKKKEMAGYVVQAIRADVRIVVVS
jgi:hypothetical protein